MTDAEIYVSLTEIFRDVFRRDDLVLAPELTAKNIPGWDSFKQIEIILAAESRYGIRFHTRELDRMHNVGDLVRVVSGKIGG